MSRAWVICLIGVGAILSPTTPAAAQQDVTPPQLESFSASPNEVDVSGSAQDVTVTAVITDDLSGVCTPAEPACSTIGQSQVALYSPSGNQSVYGIFQRQTNDTYTTTLTIPQFAENGIWRDWVIHLWDQTGNGVTWDTWGLMNHSINQVVGVGQFNDEYKRTITLHLRRNRATGYVDAELPSACFWFVPVRLERRTLSGWRQMGTTLSHFDGYYKFRISRPGKYRATAVEIGLDSPFVTTCLQARMMAHT